VNSLFRKGRRNRSILSGWMVSTFLRDFRRSIAAVCVCFSLAKFAVPCEAFEPGENEPSSIRNAQSDSNSDLIFVQSLLRDLKLFASDSLLVQVWLTPLIPRNDLRIRTSARIIETESSEGVDYQTVIGLNNDGVHCLNVNDYRGAVTNFVKALALNPDYKLARDNLAIAYNTLAGQHRKMPKEALRHYHQAMFLNPANDTLRLNVAANIRILGKDPNSFLDRVSLGDQEFSLGNFVGAAVEYKAALDLHENPAVRSKLTDAFSRMTSDQKKLNRLVVAPDTAFGISSNLSGELQNSPHGRAAAKPDIQEYVASMQAKIKKNWLPPVSNEICRIVMLFKIDQDGNISHLKLEKSSGHTLADGTALTAVEKSSPFDPLPLNPGPAVDVQFSIEQDGLANKNANAAKEPPRVIAQGTSSTKPYPEAAVNSYIIDLNRRMIEVWPTQRSKSGGHSTVLFRIDKNGTVSDITVYQSSGDKAVDESAIAAVRRAAPFAHPPDGALPLDVQYTFDSNMSFGLNTFPMNHVNHSDSSRWFRRSDHR
jgi:TonB family protein